ncbi:MAG: hypothetical protein DRP06_02270 [Candidatus Aenigmatarchaeota archaeon]|nr:MAG: hypothetical protein DRP06_02270 [Candidatus Aenigmarchaeota archaeon]
MLNPSHLPKIIGGVCEDEKIFKFFHIPVQSGSNKILKDMNQQHPINDFKKVIKNLGKNFLNPQ